MVSDLPKRVTVAGFQKMEIGSTFAIKRMLNSWCSTYMGMHAQLLFNVSF
jgi:hypothetical protein